MTTTVETFDKVDGSLGPVLTWTSPFTPFDLEVVDQQAHAKSDGPTCISRPTQAFGTDVTVSATISSMPVSGTLVFEAWVTDTSLTFGDEYYVIVHTGPPSADIDIERDESAIETQLLFADSLPTIVEGQTVSFEVLGDTIRVLVDDVEYGSVVDPDPLTGTYVGLGMNDGSGDGLLLDNFSVDSVPALGTMFMPPSFGRIPTTWPRGHEMNALMRNFRPRQEGTNVYFLSDGTVTETDPDSTTVFWDKSWGSPYVAMAWWGSTADPYELTTAQAQALTDAGYILT